MTRTHEEYGSKGYVSDQRAFFDKLITQDWDTYHNPIWDKTRQIEASKILEYITRPRSVLDVGCGVGYHDVLFAESSTVERVLGIDYSSKSIERANSYYPHAKVERQAADIFDPDLPLNLGQFDLVASFQVIEHLEKPLDFLRACAALAVPQGYVAVVTPNQARLENRILRRLGLPPKLIDPLHYAEFTRQSLIELAASAGLLYKSHFAHTLHLSFGKVALLNGNSRLGVWLGQHLDGLAQVIGIIFQKEGV